MPIFHAIAAMSENRVIGDHGKLPWHLPEDYRWFKHKTMGGTMIMGRKTFESIGEPLPGRETWMLSRRLAAVPGLRILSDLPSLLEECKKLPEDRVFWICGGTEIYRQFREQCGYLYLTRVKKEIPGDAFFPPFEDIYELDQRIHENPQFRVERWINKRLRTAAGFKALPPEPWPFSPKSS